MPPNRTVCAKPPGRRWGINRCGPDEGSTQLENPSLADSHEYVFCVYETQYLGTDPRLMRAGRSYDYDRLWRGEC
jgi:hypothetical protein